MRAVQYSRGTNEQKIYCLNEQQATLVITYLKNTAPVRSFKKELVRQFYLMRSELMQRKAARAELKPIRRELTDIIRDSPDVGRWAYKHFTDLAYKHALGKTAAQIRKERGADATAPAVAYMTAEELEKVSKASQQIVVLIDLGMGYEEIRDLLKLKNRESADHTAQLTV